LLGVNALTSLVGWQKGYPIFKGTSATYPHLFQNMGMDKGIQLTEVQLHTHTHSTALFPGPDALPVAQPTASKH